MTNKQSFFSETRQKVRDYVKQKMLLMKLQAIEKTSRFIGAVISGIIALLVLIFTILFLSVAAAHGLANLTGSIVWGYLIVGLIYLLLLIIITTVARKAIKRSITNFSINTFLDKNAENETIDNKH